MPEPNQATQGTESTALAPTAAPESAEIMRIKLDRAMAEFSSPFASTAAYRHYMEIAKLFAASAFVPDHFKNKPGECLIAIDIAQRMGESQLMVMQQMFTVKGRPGFSTKFMISRANRLAGFKSSIKWRKEVLGDPIEVTVKRSGSSYKYKIPNMRVTAYALDRFGEQVDNSVDTAMAIAEGWVENAKYESMPEHMFRWRSSSMLINLFAPEVMMGMQTVEELETMKDVTPSEPISRTAQFVDRVLGPREELVVDLTPTGPTVTPKDDDEARDDRGAAGQESGVAGADTARAGSTRPRLTDDHKDKIRALLAQPPRPITEEELARSIESSLDDLLGSEGETPQQLYTKVLGVVQSLKKSK